jgi:membrane protease YdiL (CAAX protease family)
MAEKKGEKEGLGWRVSLSIIVGIGWFVFLILWLFFYATDYTAYKNLAIILISVLLLTIFLGIPWIFWGMKFQTKKEQEMWKTKGFKWRIGLSIIIAFVLIIFLIYWFWSLAEGYILYQNIAIFIVSLLIIGGILGASWAPWGIKYGEKFD